MTFSVKQIDKGGYYMKGFKKLTAGFLGVVMALGVCGFTALAAGNVAKIGDKEYPTLQDAINNAGEGDTIELIDNTKENVTIASDDELTIDLGEYTITNKDGHTITNSGTLTIKGDGTVDNVTHRKAAIWNEGIMIIDGGNYTRSDENGKYDSKGDDPDLNSYYVIENRGKMTIDDAKVEANGGYSSLIENGWYNGTENAGKKNSVLIINDGYFSGGINTVKNDEYGELTINDGNFENVSQATVQNWNIATINDGDFDSDAPYCILTGSYQNYNSSIDYVNGKTEINGGTFKSADVCIAQYVNGNTNYSPTSIEINGGTFESEKGEVFDSNIKENAEEKELTLSITNGSFTSDVSAYLAEDSAFVKDEDGNYVVADKDEIKDSKFYISDEDDLKEAIANQVDGVTWVLKDTTYELKSTIKIKTDVTIEGNGAVLSYIEEIDSPTDAKERCGIHIDSGANVEINDLTINGEGNISRHGINVYSYKNGGITSVEVNNVKIVGCVGYGIVNNVSDVTVTDIETSGNGWGGINVDNSASSDAREGGAKFVMNSGVINESYSVVFENKTGAKIDAEIKDGTFKGYVGYGVNKDSFGVGVVPEDTVDINITSGTFATDVEKFIDEDSHIVKIDGEYVVMDDERDSGRHSYSLKEGKTERDDEEEEPVVTPEPEEEEGPFSDVGKDNPNYDAIVEVYEKGWMVGIADGVFAPNGTLTRGMAVTILWNRAGQPEPANVAPFLDVTSDAWYAKAVAWAYENGITSGYGDTYGPDDFLTTEQFTRMNDIANGRTPEVYVGGAPYATRGWVAGLLVME